MHRHVVDKESRINIDVAAVESPRGDKNAVIISWRKSTVTGQYRHRRGFAQYVASQL